MKNIKRKSIALLMTIAMIISCTAAVSAAEGSSANCIAAKVTETSQESPIALTDQLVVQNVTTGQNVPGNLFYINSPTYVTIIIRGNPACTVTVRKGDSPSYSKLIPSGGGSFTICRAGLGRWSYNIRFHSSSNAVAYQFVGTDYEYNG